MADDGMVPTSESDTDELIINRTGIKNRKQSKKTAKKIIEDSDSSSSDEKLELSNNNPQVKTNKRNKIEDDESSSDEKTEISNSNSHSAKKNNSSCEKSDDNLSSDKNINVEHSTSGESPNVKINDSDNVDDSINDSSISRQPDINSSHRDDDDDDDNKVIDKDSEYSNSDHSDAEKRVHKILQKKKERNKGKKCCFADSSSDEDSVETNTIPKERRSRKSERMNTKKSSFRSKLDKVKIRKGRDESTDKEIDESTEKEMNESTKASDNDQAKEKEEGEEETSHSRIVEDEMVDDIDVNKALRNNDLFDMEESASDEEKKKKKKTSVNSDNDEENNSLPNDDVSGDEEPTKKKKGGKKEKGMSKDALKEAKSEQQRLLRQQKFRLPYHIPEAKPLKDFLQRVPVMKTSKEKKKKKADKEEAIKIDDDNEVVENGESKPKQGIDSLFKQKPKLSFGTGESIEFGGSIEFEDVKSNEISTKKKGVLDSFMARFEKHTKNTKKDLQNKDGSPSNPIIVNDMTSAKDDDKLPGGRRVAFKEHMRQKIKRERCEVLKEVEKEMKLYNEESSSASEESDDSDDDDDNEEKKDDEVENAHADDGGESSNDEELAKWNLDDERKALEVEMGEEEVNTETGEHCANSVDFCIEPRKTTQPEKQEKDDLMHWDDTSSTISSVLPAGQGDPTAGRKNSCDGGRITPFSKLIKSGLLDSASKQNDNSSSNQGLVPALSLPCENTQDLYKDISAPARQLDEEESESVFDNFRMFLNEESQYTQAIDSQGFLNDSKKSKRQPAKRLFDEDEKDEVNDFSQVIGLCSGKFDDNCTSSVGDGIVSNKDEVDRVCSSSNKELSMSQVIGLCSGKFSDDETMASTKIDSTSKSNVICTDDGSMSNPPMEHPFSSRIHTDDEHNNKKQSSDLPTFGNESQFADTAEDIFESNVERPSLNSKPSCISDIIDDNFDDNAIDFCTAPFSTQSTAKEVCEVEVGTQELVEDDDLLPETKFDVGNWLKGDKQVDEKESESRSSDSSNGIGGVGKTTRKQRIVESDEDDDEDDVFDDKDNKDEEEGEKKDNDYEDGDEVDDNEDVDDATGSEKDDDYDDEDEIQEELLEYQDAITVKKKKWSKNAFTEKEAELSGSDVDSDEEELGSEYDEYEVDSDIENLPDAEKLKRQLHKIHQRKVVDEDQHQLKLLQELYLEDGDLGDGKKRQRNFKWRSVDDDDSYNNATVHSGDEEDELNLDGNISQKLERAEREKYIYELQESQKTIMDENSQSMLEMIKDPASIVTEKSMQKLKTKLVSKVEGRVLSQKQLGSFMSQKKSSLSHLSSAAKAGGGQGSKAFVFQATEDEKKLSVDKENKSVPRKAPASFSGPAKKRVKMSSVVETSESQSIFDLL